MVNRTPAALTNGAMKNK